ncbi:MAG: oxygenase MpaB family protein, partial [Chloroflexota bacterium]|nr:oxygenase MpaB family protein [Chloroflexota bacterium]
MFVPSDYASGYEKARLVDADLAARYVEHTTIGDPDADALANDLASFGHEEGARLITAAMNEDDASLKDAPQSLLHFFERCTPPPAWVDFDAFAPGVRMFHRNAPLVLGGMAGGTLIEGFSTNIAKSFFITGRLRDQGVRRLRQNNRHMVEIFMPGGLRRQGDGWKLSVRIRLVHAMVRRLLAQSDDWDAEAWGAPISAAHVGYALTAFSARLLKHLKSLGGRFDQEERAGFIAVWRYSGYLLGVPESILYTDEEDALRLFEIGGMCEPPVSMESVVLASSLVQSAALVAGIEESRARRKLAHYVYRVSRALIRPPLANQLRYPRYPTFGVLWFFRMQNRYERYMSKLFKNRARRNNNLTSLFDVSAFDEQGITYT